MNQQPWLSKYVNDKCTKCGHGCQHKSGVCETCREFVCKMCKLPKVWRDWETDVCLKCKKKARAA